MYKKSYRDDRGGGFKGGKKSFGGGSRGPSRGGSSDGMHEATCATCGNACQVPFRPYPGKSIFCNSCFRRDEDGSTPKRGDRPTFAGKRPFAGGGQDNSRIEARLAAIEAKLDALIEALMEGVEGEEESEGDEEKN